MSELLFECYNVPSVAYGIDSLFSLYNNMPSSGELIQMFSWQTVCGHPSFLRAMHGLSSEVLSQKKNQSLLMAYMYHGQKKNCNWFQSSSVLSIHALFHICFDIYTFFPVLSSIFYCKTHKTVNTRRLYYGMLLCSEKIANKA